MAKISRISKVFLQIIVMVAVIGAIAYALPAPKDAAFAYVSMVGDTLRIETSSEENRRIQMHAHIFQVSGFDWEKTVSLAHDREYTVGEKDGRLYISNLVIQQIGILGGHLDLSGCQMNHLEKVEIRDSKVRLPG